MRNIKVLKFTAKKNFEDIEQAINETCMDLDKAGQKVINITPTVVPMTPVTVLYTITYEE